MARFFGKSRSQKRAERTLGIIQPGKGFGTTTSNKRCRTPELEEIDKYLKNEQYDGKQDWREAEKQDVHVPISDRKPFLIFPFAKVLQNRVSAKLVGKDVFPTLEIEESEDDQEFLKIVMKAVEFKSKMLQASKQFISHGSVFMRFKLSAGKMVLEHFNPKWCFPTFKSDGDLLSMRIQYVFEDPEQLDENGKPTEKWFRLDLGEQADVLYDNPEFQADANPTFTVVNRAEHNLGFVQGEWIRTTENKHNPDGESIVTDAMGFIDALNYNLSQSDRAVSYGLDPQLVLTGMDSEEMESLIKSSFKAWHLGRPEADAKYLEVQGTGVKSAEETRLSFTKNIMDFTRVIFLDPEKIVGNAQSAKAMEVLHGPMLELINELRPQTEKGAIRLLQKMMTAYASFNARGFEVGITMPPGYQPTSLDIIATWPQIFPLTILDIQQLIGSGTALAGGNIASRETVLKWLMAKGVDLPIEDLEEEIRKVDTQKEFNTFGGF